VKVPGRSSLSVDRVAIAAGIDTALVVTFVAIGRRNHEEDPGVTGLISTGAPFLVGLAAGWLVATAWNKPFHLRTGLTIWPVTVLIGMIGRRIVGDGTAISFVIVATLFTGATLVGWRAIRAAAAARRHAI
jgi:hypothetical protein